jgi:uridine monophosphate synthetase
MNLLPKRLFDAGCIKFGEFTLKSGLKSPIYVDLRLLVSEPTLLRDVSRAMAGLAQRIAFDRIAAIPYAGLPIGVAISLEMDRPLVYPRQEVKAHGTRRAVEGDYRQGEIALLVDDVITRGGSKLEAIATLEESGLKVRDVLVLIDREQGGGEDLARAGYILHSVFRLASVIEMLYGGEQIDEARYAEVMAYLQPGD